MPIIELQRRVREIGRLRIGQKVATSNGRSRPSKLDTFRFTSRDRQVIDAAAARWGGTVEAWDDAPDGDQWQVTSETAELSVVIPPTDMGFSQWFELWSAGGCQRRCDGQRDLISDGPCKCDPEARECSMHTRLSVMLPELPGFGLWRLDTQGYYAAAELGGLVEMCQRFTAQGTLLPARLRLEQRSVKRPKPGGGGVETRRYAVPVLDIDVHPLALTGGLNPATGELTAPAAHTPALPAGNLTPVPEVVDGAGAPSIAEQMAGIDEPQPRAARANAARPIPPTGVKPRTARDAANEAPAPQLDTEKVDQIRTQLNDLGADARRLFLEEFGCPPKELRLEQLDAAVAFVEALAPFDDDDPSGGSLPAGPSSVPGEGEGVGEVTAGAPDPAPSTPDPVHARGVTVADVAKLAAEVFRGEYDAAPRGTKTKVVDRLRHAFTFACTGRVWSGRDCTPEELAVVYQRLHLLRTGAMTYEVTGDGVSFGVPDSDGRAVVAWALLDEQEAAA